MADITDDKQASLTTRIVGGDENYAADVVEIDGKKKLLTDTSISSVNVPLGKDPFPDTYFEIITAGAIGDTITIDIAATNNDTTTPDFDIPAYQYIYTLVAEDVGNEKQLSINLADALNADPNFNDQQFLEAEAIAGDKRPTVHITSTEFSLNGENYERPNIGDFEVTTTGTTTIQFFSSDFRSIVSRAKEVSLGRDPNNPHRLGVQTIAGTVFLRSSDPDKLIRTRIEEFGNPGAFNLNVNGSVTPIIFRFSANIDGEPDRIIYSLKIFGNDTNIKAQVGNFLGRSALTNGLLIEFYREGQLIYSENLINTVDILGLWSTSASDNKIINASGGDYLESTFSLVDKNLAFVLENGEDSYVQVSVRDDLTSIDALYMLIDGSED